VPKPLTERQALEAEIAEILAQTAAYRSELESGSPHRVRRERLEWSIREREKRLADVRARLAAITGRDALGGDTSPAGPGPADARDDPSATAAQNPERA